MSKRVYKHITIWITAILIAGGIAVLPATAGHKGHGFHGNHEMEFGLGFLKRLNLTHAQKTEILAILEKYESEIGTLRTNLQEARKKMHSAMKQVPFSEDQIRVTYQEMSPLLEDMFVLRAKIKNEIRALLTDDQRMRLQNHREDWIQKQESHRGDPLEMLKKWLQSGSNATP